MTDNFFHGVRVEEVQNKSSPIKSVQSAVIGLVGTAPSADVVKFPENVPVLLNDPEANDTLGDEGSLPKALRGIYDQVGAQVVLVRISDQEASDGEDAPVIQGIKALKESKVQPKLLIAPGLSSEISVARKLTEIAQYLRAIAIIEGPGTDNAAAIALRDQLNSDRVFIVEPKVTIDGGESVPVSPYVAGLIALVDSTEGFWNSPSNKQIKGITGTERPISFSFYERGSTAHTLNEKDIATIIYSNGYRLWGLRTCSNTDQFKYLSVRRTADILNESLLASHLWAVDKNITSEYVNEVSERVNAFLRDLKGKGAIKEGRCEVNRKDTNEKAGKIQFDFVFTPYYPAEQIVFRSQLSNGELKEL